MDTDHKKTNMDRKTEVTIEDIIRRLSHDHIKPYYDWLRQLLGLSSGALTLLVALQRTYIPIHPLGLPLLQLCWGLLALTVLSTLTALYGESATLLGAANKLGRIYYQEGDEKAHLLLKEDNFVRPATIYVRARIVAVFCFAFAISFLALFAALNVCQSQ